MSTTSGPMVPPYTGSSRSLPSSFSTALLFASIVVLTPSCMGASSGAQFFHNGPEVRVRGLGSSHHEVQQVIVGHREERLEDLALTQVQLLSRPGPEPLED